MRVLGLLVWFLIPLTTSLGQNIEAGKSQFASRCVICHGGDAMGGEHGPAIIRQIFTMSEEQMTNVIREGHPAKGMPPINLNDQELADLLAFLPRLRRAAPAPQRVKLETAGGGAIEGTLLHDSAWDVQVRTNDGKIALLRRDGDKYRQVTSEVNWSTYHGTTDSNRFTTIGQITKENVWRLAPQWIYTVESNRRLQVTPVVVDGIMYVTSANECYALDAGSGRELWRFQRPRTEGLIGNAAGGINRGVAIAGDRLFMVTDHAHLLALNRFTGEVLWDTEMADWRLNYNATSAPLIVGDLVISGTAGGDEGVRGFLAAYDQQSGKEVWRFWTVPLRGEPGSETWIGDDIDHGAGATWITGSYDAELDTLYWASGNPGPDLNGDNRIGDNLYTSCVLALDPKTGKLKWYFQFTPHNIWDWDAQQPIILVDANWQGQPRKLLLQTNRNGFFYVLDRENGALLMAKPFVEKLTWASEIGKDGRPVLVPGMGPSFEGTEACPSMDGASNWFSGAYNPGTGLLYFQALEKCAIYVKRAETWQAGRSYMGGMPLRVPGEKPQKFLRALDIQTGDIVWELPQNGPGNTWGGVLGTATGLVFVAEDGGSFLAADAENGKPLWRFQANADWKASPMTYVFDGKQHIAVAAGSNILVFALNEEPSRSR